MKSSQSSQPTFRELVYSIARRIPKGKVATYGQIAALTGNSKAARAVGALMRTNPYAPEVPCHRVVAADGSLTGYTAEGGIAQKRLMLENEGVHFNGNKVDMKLSCWKTKRHTEK